MNPLIKALKDKNSTIRMGAAWTLGKMGDARAIDPLIKTLKNKSEFVREDAAEGLGNLGDLKAVKPLIAAFQYEDEVLDVLKSIAKTLGKFADPRAVEPLVAALKYDHEDPDYKRIRKTVMNSLERIGTPEAKKAIKKKISRKAKEPSSLRKAVDRLIEIYHQNPKGFGPEEDCTVGEIKCIREIRHIGRSLNKLGGISLMRKAHGEFNRRCEIFGASRNLDLVWDGIGSWRG